MARSPWNCKRSPLSFHSAWWNSRSVTTCKVYLTSQVLMIASSVVLTWCRIHRFRRVSIPYSYITSRAIHEKLKGHSTPKANRPFCFRELILQSFACVSDLALVVHTMIPFQISFEWYSKIALPWRSQVDWLPCSLHSVRMGVISILAFVWCCGRKLVLLQIIGWKSPTHLAKCCILEIHLILAG